VAHVFGERTLATLERLLSLLSAFEVVVWMTDGWPLYESRLKGKLHVNSKRYTGVSLEIGNFCTIRASPNSQRRFLISVCSSMKGKG
jgi:insertion element IS1 protein InsB